MKNRGFIAVLVIIAMFIYWRGDTRPDLHTEIQQRLLEAEIGSAATFHFESGSRAIVPNDRATDTLLANLTSSVANIRWTAAKELAVRRDPRAVEAVIRAMCDPDGTIRVCVMASALGHLKDPRALSALTEAVFDPGNRDLRLCAIQSLGMIGDRSAVPTLIEALRARNTPIAAANAIARMGDERGVQPIIEIAGDLQLRLWMVMALGELGSANASPYLSSLGEENKPSVRHAIDEAQWKIAQLSTAQPVSRLIDVLVNEEVSNRRMWAAFRLGELKQKAAIPALLQSLNDESEAVRGRSAAALIRIGDPALPVLRQRVTSDAQHSRLYAATILGYVGKPGDIPLLKEVASNSEDDVLTESVWRSIELIEKFNRPEMELINIDSSDAG